MPPTRLPRRVEAEPARHNLVPRSQEPFIIHVNRSLTPQRFEGAKHGYGAEDNGRDRFAVVFSDVAARSLVSQPARQGAVRGLNDLFARQRVYRGDLLYVTPQDPELAIAAGHRGHGDSPNLFQGVARRQPHVLELLLSLPRILDVLLHTSS